MLYDILPAPVVGEVWPQVRPDITLMSVRHLLWGSLLASLLLWGSLLASLLGSLLVAALCAEAAGTGGWRARIRGSGVIVGSGRVGPKLAAGLLLLVQPAVVPRNPFQKILAAARVRRP